MWAHQVSHKPPTSSVRYQLGAIWLPLRMIFVQAISFEMSTFTVFTPPGTNGSTIEAGTQQTVTKMSGIVARPHYGHPLPRW